MKVSVSDSVLTPRNCSPKHCVATVSRGFVNCGIQYLLLGVSNRTDLIDRFRNNCLGDERVMQLLNVRYGNLQPLQSSYVARLWSNYLIDRFSVALQVLRSNLAASQDDQHDSKEHIASLICVFKINHGKASCYIPDFPLHR